MKWRGSFQGRFWMLYPLWILVCVILFLALRDVEDPSRPPGRLTKEQATEKSLAALHQIDHDRFRDYEVVHIAYAPPKEPGGPGRLIVLTDRTERTALREAMVVELDAAEGQVLQVRRVEN